MGQDPDPYAAHDGGFTPYQPDATPDGEPASGEAPAPTRRRWPWVVAVAVVAATIGGCVSGIVGVLDGDEDSPDVSSPEVFVNDLVYGQCLIGGGFGTEEPISGLEVVECTTAHDAQVLAVKILSAEEAENYEFDDTGQVDRNCRSRFTRQDMHLLEREDLVLIAFTETENPVQGDKVACLLARADGAPLEGDFRDQMQDPTQS